MKHLNQRLLCAYAGPLLCVLLLTACSGGADTTPEASADTEATADVDQGEQSPDSESPPVDAPDAVSKDDVEASDAAVVTPDAAETPDATPAADTSDEADAPTPTDTSTESDATEADVATPSDVTAEEDTTDTSDVTAEADTAPEPADSSLSDAVTGADTEGPTDTATDTQANDDSSDDTTDELDAADSATTDVEEGTPCIFGGLPACPDDAYCDTGGCGLGLEGVCVPKPYECDLVGEAVCACDGNTYANACVAQQAGQRAIGPGPCPASEWDCTVDTTGWGFGDGCGTNEYCFGGCIGEGFCKERPICGDQQMNVQCGCSGMDYGSPCLIASAGKNIDHDGWCGEPNFGTVEACGGPEGDTCSVETDFCDLQSCAEDADGKCVGIWQPGVAPGEICMPSAPEECGCDDVTYMNKCARILAGVALQHQGACGMSSCDLQQSGQCGMGLYCMAPMGQCAGEGVCKASSLMCGLIPGGDIPVCACSGETYESLCHAQKADAPVSHYGECTN